MSLNVSWQISTVETADFSTWPSMAFSPSGQTAIAYYSSDNKALRFVTLNAERPEMEGTVRIARPNSGEAVRALL